MAQKRGVLRVLKQGRTIFGPLSRADLEKLLEQKRVSVTDQVSVNDGPWQVISSFLVETTAVASKTPFPGLSYDTPPASRPKPASQKTLRILCGNKIFGPMSRDQVMVLLNAGRVKSSDLICAIDGPWMPISNFLTPAPSTAKSRGLPPLSPTPQPAPQAIRQSAPRPAPQSPHVPPSTPPAPAAPHQAMPPALPRVAPAEAAAEPEIVEVTIDDVLEEAMRELAPFEESLISQMLPPSQAPLPNETDRVAPPLSTYPEWFVRIRGMPSTHLSKAQLKALIIAREIHPETPATHMNWEENDWRPIRSIRELAALLKFAPTD